MATFEINGKEYELRLEYEGIARLNNAFKQEGGSFGVIGKAISGDLEAFPTIVHAALLHTGEGFKQKQVAEEIMRLISEQKLSLEEIHKLSNEIVTENFFYKPTAAKLMKQNPDMKKAYEQLMN